MTTGLYPEFALITVSLYAPPGTRIPMQQAAAPLGWITDTTFSDTSMRYNAGAGSGGSTGWSSWNFGGTFNVNAFGLSVAQLPAHNHGDAGHTHGDFGHTHGDNGHAHGVSDPSHSHGLSGSVPQLSGGSDLAGNGGTHITYNASINGAFTGIGIDTGYASIATGYANLNTGYANIQNTGSGAAIQPNFTTPQVKFADHIVAQKS